MVDGICWLRGSVCSLHPSGYCVSVAMFLASDCGPSKINSWFPEGGKKLSNCTENCERLLLIIEEEAFV